MEPEISLLLETARKQIEADMFNERLICQLIENRENLIGCLCSHYSEQQAGILARLKVI